MEDALKLIEKNLADMKKRAEKAEYELQLLKGRSSQEDMNALHEKSNIVVQKMESLGLRSQESLVRLIESAKEFNMILELMKSFTTVTEVYQNQ